MIAYCVRCAAKREMLNAKPKVLKSGKHIVEGTCPSCGSRIFSSEHQKDTSLSTRFNHRV